MAKSFIKAETKRKTFFGEGVVFRSFAYGESARKDFADSLAFYLKRRDTVLSKAWDVTGNGLFGELTDVGRAKEVTVKRVDSVLAPLVFNGKLYTSTDGNLLSDGEVFAKVQDTKGWCIAVCRLDAPTEGELFVVCRGEGYGFTVKHFGITEDGVIGGENVYELDATFNAESYIASVGKHVFLIHNGVLRYFEYDCRKNKLGEVAIGSDCQASETTACVDVTGKIAFLTDGKVCWRAGDRLYCFTVGAPKNVTAIAPCPQDSEITDIFSYGDMLCVQYKIASVGRRFIDVYRSAGQNFTRKRTTVFGQNIVTRSGLLTVKDDKSVTITDKEGNTKSYKNVIATNCAGKAACVNGRVYMGVRAVREEPNAICVIE